MPYVLGIDIADAHVSAAVCQVTDDGWAAPESVTLDPYRHVMPSVLHISPQGDFTVGEESASDGGWIARDFIKRIGDDVPMMVTGQAYAPQALTALLVLWAAEQVAEARARRAEHIVVSYPAGWGPYRVQLLTEALWQAGLGEVTLLPEPSVAAELHSWHTGAGETLAVLSLGADDHATSVVRRGATGGFELLATQRAAEPLGAGDLDEALAERVGKALLGKHYSLAALREECAQARERLTAAAETDVLGVPVTRDEFEELTQPLLHVTVDSLVRTVRATGLRPDQLDSVVVTGTGGRTPVLPELIAAEFPCPVSVDVDPQIIAAAGAALAACRILSPPAGPVELDGYQSVEDDAPDDYADYGADAAELPPRPPVRITKLKLPRRRSPSRLAHAKGFTFF